MANSNSRSSNSTPRQGHEYLFLGLNNTGRGGGGDAQGAVGRHNPAIGYGPYPYESQTVMESWETNQRPLHSTRALGAMHDRSTSDHLQTTSPGATEYANLYNRRSSAPSNVFVPQRASQSQPAPDSHTRLQVFQGPPPMVVNRYQQHPTQSIIHDQLSPLMIPPTHGGITPSPHSGSPSHTPWYTPQSSPDLQARLQLNPGLSTDRSLPPYVSQMNLTIPDAIHGGDRGTMGRTPRPKSRMRPYQPLDARRGSWTHDTTGQLQSGGSSVGFSPVASSDESRVEDSGSATSPGTESDTYYNIPDTPAENHGAPPEGPDEATLRDQRRKEKQKLTKRGDRKRESDQFKRVKELLGLKPSGTKAETLEAVIGHLGGKVPPQWNAPTSAHPERERTERATQMVVSRADTAQLYDVIAKCMEYTTGGAPKRELLLKEAADEIERRRAGTQPHALQGGGGSGGNHWMAQ